MKRLIITIILAILPFIASAKTYDINNGYSHDNHIPDSYALNCPICKVYYMKGLGNWGIARRTFEEPLGCGYIEYKCTHGHIMHFHYTNDNGKLKPLEK